MDTWDVRVIDGTDEKVTAQLWEVCHAADTAQRPFDLFWPWQSARISWADADRVDMRRILLGAYDGVTVCGAAEVYLPLLDNTHMLYGGFYVHPDHQRRGAGRALVETASRLARDQGRTTIVVEAYALPGEDSTGLMFGRALGFAEAIEEGMKVVDLPATEHLWAGLEQAAAPRHTDYRIVTVLDVLPDELVDGYCRINEVFNDEAPMGDLDVEPEKWDVERVRDREARNARAGQHVFTALALAPDGAVVGATEVVLSQNAPTHAMQSGTLVLSEHRGHRLGIAMKIANQRAIRDRFPECVRIFTGNAGVNAAMNAVNERLGFRFVERCVELQKTLR